MEQNKSVEVPELASEPTTEPRQLSLLMASLPILVTFLLLVIGYGQFDLAIEPLLIISAVFAAGIAVYHGYTWLNIQNAIVKKLSDAMPSLLILLLVGGLIGSWVIGGTIPLLVYYGLAIITPEYLAITAFLVTAFVSLCIGTSWGSAGTIGVALMGVAVSLNAPVAIVAGAVVSGAYFGDKLSPLSDTTNLAPTVAGTDLYSHIRHMLWTTIPGFILSCIVFTFALQVDSEQPMVSSQEVAAILANIQQLYDLNLLLLLPPVLVLFGAIKKYPTIPVMLAACGLGCFNAFYFQGFSLEVIFQAFLNGFYGGMFPADTFINPDVAKIINRGGVASMLDVLLLVICAFSFAGALSVSGGLQVIVKHFAKGITNVFSLIGATIATTLLVVGTTADGKLALIVPAELFKDMYKDFKLSYTNLSRTIEDAGTVIEPLMPWTAAGVFMASTLNVPTLDYLPWAIQCHSGVIFALILAATGIGISTVRAKSNEQQVVNG
ncbi:Na+/H+ antiporter NhaC [Parashewanella curva]|uniref:Na+/H+ antiporter NhaC n=1 Tax=Parashewanella curva TaxID=2338552 RepID=A0A3L8PU30_9GAMM|nr:Na+/H+ antiporter NhaC [Parashewanella curva]RLV58925.1 Na+/H+ antiporter NhaC [Parashewanella curva]